MKNFKSNVFLQNPKYFNLIFRLFSFIRVSNFRLFLFFVLSFFVSCAKAVPVKDTNIHNYFALREITLGKENTLYLSTRSAYIPKENNQNAFEKFQELHAENKIRRSYWKCNLKNSVLLECTEELSIKDEPNEVIPK